VSAPAKGGDVRWAEAGVGSVGTELGRGALWACAATGSPPRRRVNKRMHVALRALGMEVLQELSVEP
jgi:hypothetical protein